MKKKSQKEVEVTVERIISVADEVSRVMFPLFAKNKMNVAGSTHVFAILLDHFISIVQRRSGESFKDVKSVIMGLINSDIDAVNEMKEDDEREHEKEA